MMDDQVYPVVGMATRRSGSWWTYHELMTLDKACAIAGVDKNIMNEHFKSNKKWQSKHNDVVMLIFRRD